MKTSGIASLAQTTALLGCLALSASSAVAQEPVKCLTAEERQTHSLYNRLLQDAVKALDRRDAAVEQLQTVEQVKAEQSRLREAFLNSLGRLPERSPLNAQTVRTIPADGYRIECVVFDSVPHHRITGNLYLPDAAGPVPAVVVSSGHSRTAKTADYNQRFALMMVRQGMAALCFDPIGQGERSQFLTDDGRPRFGGTTTEHTLLGIGSILVGRNTARYRLWDAMRAIDYVSSRPEVDASRIGFTGCSGGGTMTSYVMALDDRVRCAAPACYLTTLRHLLTTIGPQDAEQNIWNQLNFGMDHPDYLLMRAPAPTLISSTTDDYFSIVGAWENYRRNKRTYSLLGYPERVDLVESPGGHGVHPENLSTIGHWMQRWLQNRDAAVDAVELPVRSEAELLCLPSAQVGTDPNEKTVIDLNTEYAQQLAGERQAKFSDRTPAQLREQIRQVLPLPADPDRVAPKHEDRGEVQFEDQTAHRFVLTTADGAVLPGLVFRPEKPANGICVLLHDAGKNGDQSFPDRINQLLKQGRTVITVDLSGQGEVAAGPPARPQDQWKNFFMDYLLGRSLVGRRTQDVLDVATFAAQQMKTDTDQPKVHLIAFGITGLAALHAAALHPGRFATVTTNDTPASWSDVVSNPAPEGLLDTAVHGALEVYDLTDLQPLLPQKTSP